MKKHIYLLIFVLLTVPNFVIGQSKIMTFNIRYNNPNDNDNQWEYRKSEAVNMIDFYAPDILGIQEGLNSQVKYLDSALTGYNYIGVGRNDGKTKGEYAALFYKIERLKLLFTKSYWLSETPDKVSVGWDASMERIATFGEFVDLQTKDTLYVLNCHFDHKGPVARENSANLLLKIINDRNLTYRKVIVMGDMNSEPTDKPIEILQTELNDAHNISQTEPTGPVGTFNGFDVKASVEKRIDYIFVKNIKVLNYMNIDDRRKNNLYLSDHLPVLITIE